MSKLDLLTVSSEITTLLSSIPTTGSAAESRLWEGDNGSLYVYNLKEELWVSSNGGASWTNKYPDDTNTVHAGDYDAVGRKVSAITQYLVDATETSGSSDVMVIFVSTSTKTDRLFSDTQY